eukprot:jgi/Tetstr1/445394/TSEL_033178.t3
MVATARGRRERDAQPEACQRCSSGRSLSRSVLNPLRDLPGAGLRDVSCCWVTCKERQRRRAMELAKTRSWL